MAPTPLTGRAGSRLTRRQIISRTPVGAPTLGRQRLAAGAPLWLLEHVNEHEARAAQSLRALALGYTVFAALLVATALYFAQFIRLGIDVVNETIVGKAPPPTFGWVYIAIGGVGVSLGVGLAVLATVAAHSIALRKRLGLIRVTAGVACIFIPLGTLLGVLSFVVLSTDHAKSLFRTRS